MHSPVEIDRSPALALCFMDLEMCRPRVLCNNSVTHRARLSWVTGTSIPLRSTPYPRFRILFCSWTVLGVLAFARYILLTGSAKPNLLAELLGWLSCYYAWLLLTPLLFRLERRFPLDKRWLNVAVLAMIGLPVSYCAYEITLFMNAGVRVVLHSSPISPTRWWPFPAREIGLEQALYWFTVLAACVIRNVAYLREKEHLAAQLAVEKAELESNLRGAELETLRMRLNPHFLFNCLQSISSLSQKDPKTAGQMVKHLGDLLRVALKDQTQAECTLATEMALVDAYVAIEQMRFGERLSVSRDIELGTEKALIPAFLLQPLIENAIKHGLRAENKSGSIWIKSYRDSSQLVLTVSDNGVGLSNDRIAELEMGIGLSSTCERLARMYAQQHSFSIRPLAEGGAEVRVALPFRNSDSFGQEHS
jgi:two-component system, LytTR family, sensor kinase